MSSRSSDEESVGTDSGSDGEQDVPMPETPDEFKAAGNDAYTNG